MPVTTEFPARGIVTAVEDGLITFNPLNTNYELRLIHKGSGIAAGQRVEGIIRVVARKIWTVPSGGNFMSPVLGPPRVLQGRIRQVEGNTLVLHAGVPVMVKISNDQETLDLVNGPLVAGTLANVTALPGATFERLA